MFRNVTRTEWCLLVLLVGLGVASRFFIETPNFKPLAAFALLGGFLFRKPGLAVVAVVAALLLSDLQIGFYSPPMMICVYGSLVLAVGLGMWIRTGRADEKMDSRTIGQFFGASLAMSTVFFLTTNAAVWWMGFGYSPTAWGLLESYTAGLPFYRWTLLGDLFFTGVTVAAYSICCQGSSEKSAAKFSVQST